MVRFCQLGWLRPFGGSISMPLRRRCSVVQATASGRRVAPHLAGDRRRCSLQPASNMTYASSLSAQKSNLLGAPAGQETATRFWYTAPIGIRSACRFPGGGGTALPAVADATGRLLGGIATALGAAGCPWLERWKPALPAQVPDPVHEGWAIDKAPCVPPGKTRTALGSGRRYPRRALDEAGVKLAAIARQFQLRGAGRAYHRRGEPGRALANALHEYGRSGVRIRQWPTGSTTSTERQTEFWQHDKGVEHTSISSPNYTTIILRINMIN